MRYGGFLVNRKNIVLRDAPYKSQIYTAILNKIYEERRLLGYC
jgi:hypothetical protein